MLPGCRLPHHILTGWLAHACSVRPPYWLLALASSSHQSCYCIRFPRKPPPPRPDLLHSPCGLVAKAFKQKVRLFSDSKMTFLIKTAGLQSMMQKITADKGTDLAPCRHVLKSQQCPWALQPSLRGHRILEDETGSFLLKQRTQTQVSEVARCP